MGPDAGDQGRSLELDFATPAEPRYHKRTLVQHEYIRTPAQLHRFCEQLSSASMIGFDTEFVSEDTYRPDLCLIQVAADEHLAVIDPRDVRDVTPFWDAICTGNHLTVVHAGREEFRFCFHAMRKRPQRLFDIQIAAGLIGLEYPASYGKLLQKLLDVELPKGETRTDWRRRPLSPRQIEYAIQDVTYLKPLYDCLHARLDTLGRLSWMDDEMTRWQTELEEFELRENWRRVSGSTGLSEKAMVIVRELWRWREAEAEAQNRPPRRVLRDDLLVELARRGKSDPQQIRAIRGIERSLSKRHFDAVADCIQRALALPRSEWPTRPPRKPSSHGSLVGQFIATALGSICRSLELAPSLVGTVQDVRDLVEYRLVPPA
ncbi:MAG: HRDC domain-containing protein, partial [Planctomycetales bacterium]|nr:HRDC domain-containing protein [Planctomycetales bacterium]